MKTVLLGLVMAAGMLAETVHFGNASKAFHKTVTCSTRGGKAHQLHAERAEAIKHGLHECKRCWRAAAACATDSECEGVKASKGNGAWAQKSAPAKVAEVSK
jgi:hypothetical protein